MAMTPNSQQIPVKIVGSSIFGRNPIVSDERTYNMYISDGWLFNFAGYHEAVQILPQGYEGRGLYHSIRGNFLIVVLATNVYRIDPNFGYRFLFTLNSSAGEVVMDENLSSQIVIVDGTSTCYIYNYTPGIDQIKIANLTGSFSAFIPNYVTYQNTYFVFGNGSTDNSGSQWFVFSTGYTAGPTTAWDLAYVQTLTLQTKPDFAKAAIRMPGHGNYLLVLGSSVGELWNQSGGLEVYTRNQSINIDYGVASVATIASSDEMIAWLGINEKSSPAIMVMRGGKAEGLSTDGIDKLLSYVKYPDQSTAMFYREDGHVFYILTFFNDVDNFSIMYDFTTEKFFDITDWDFTYHPARQIAYFNNEIYFVSIKQGSLMHISTDLTDMSTNAQDVYQIPRIRKCDTYRMPGSIRFIVNQFSFTIENGVEPDVDFNYECDGFILGEVSNGMILTEDGSPILTEAGSCSVYRPRIDVTISKNGGHTYGNAVSYFMHATGDFNNQPRFNQLGQANQFTIQMRFWGLGNFIVQDGYIEVRI